MILSNEENTVLDGVEGHVILSHLLEVPWYSFKSLGDRTKVVALHFYPWTLISIENIPNNQYREKISNLLLEATDKGIEDVRIIFATNKKDFLVMANINDARSYAWKRIIDSATKPFNNLRRLSDKEIEHAYRSAKRLVGEVRGGWFNSVEENLEMIDGVVGNIFDKFPNFYIGTRIYYIRSITIHGFIARFVSFDTYLVTKTGWILDAEKFAEPVRKATF